MLDDDVAKDVVSEPSSPGSTYEMSSLPSVLPAMQQEFTSLEALETQRDDHIGDGDGNMTDYYGQLSRDAPSPFCSGTVLRC
jgi:hypothetical protein